MKSPTFLKPNIYSADELAKFNVLAADIYNRYHQIDLSQSWKITKLFKKWRISNVIYITNFFIKILNKLDAKSKARQFKYAQQTTEDLSSKLSVLKKQFIQVEIIPYFSKYFQAELKRRIDELEQELAKRQVDYLPTQFNTLVEGEDE